jgi:hypothetical protein
MYKVSWTSDKSCRRICDDKDPNMKMCTLDPHVPMLKGWVGPSSFSRIMSLKVVFQICFGSIKMMGTRGILVYQSGNPFMYQSRTPASSSTSIFLVICTHATWKYKSCWHKTDKYVITVLGLHNVLNLTPKFDINCNFHYKTIIDPFMITVVLHSHGTFVSGNNTRFNVNVL